MGRFQQPHTQRPGLDEQGWVIIPSHARQRGRPATPDSGGVRGGAPRLITAGSMGAQQAYHLGGPGPRAGGADLLPSAARPAPNAPHACSCSALRQALKPPIPAWDGTRFRASPEQGLRTFALIYASWAASQALLQAGPAHEALGYGSRFEAYVGSAAGCPPTAATIPTILLAMLDTWLGQ